MRKLHNLLFALFLITIGLGFPAHLAYSEGESIASEITISAAASLKNAFNEIGALYKRRTGTKVVFNFAASGVLQKQIEGGAPVDVFASAAKKQMDELEAKGFISSETRKDFSGNVLVLAVPRNSKLSIKSFKDLKNAEFKKIAIGNPKTVPAGQYAEQVLVNLKLWSKIQSKLILGENVRQVLDYVARGEVDAGVVYSSDVTLSGVKVRVAAEAPKNIHDPILYAIAVLRESKHDKAGKDFIDLVMSEEGQSILRKYGFLNLKQK